MKIKVKKLSADAVIPKYATPGAAGFDLVAIEDVTLNPGETKLIKTGLTVEVPQGFELQVRPRSGTSLKTHLRIANAPGTVDSDYRGEIGIIGTNISGITDLKVSRDFFGGLTDVESNSPYVIVIKKGERIAQGVISPVIQAEFEEATELSDTQRGAGGFGSTGK